MSGYKEDLVILFVEIQSEVKKKNKQFFSFFFLFSGIWHCAWEYINYKQNSATITTIGFTTNFQSYLEVQETWLAFCECH